MKILSEHKANITIFDINKNLWMIGVAPVQATHRFFMSFYANGGEWIWDKWFDIDVVSIQGMMRNASDVIKRKLKEISNG